MWINIALKKRIGSSGYAYKAHIENELYVSEDLKNAKAASSAGIVLYNAGIRYSIYSYGCCQISDSTTKYDDIIIWAVL